MSWAPQDYSGWDWKAIQSAILGSVDTDANTLLAAQQQTSVPQTFYDAGRSWTGLSGDLQATRTSLAAGSNDLLGGAHPWTGKAADGLRALLDRFDSVINDHIGNLNGPPPAAVTMDNAGDALQTAINDITAANQEAAAQTMAEYQTKLAAFQAGQAGATDPGPSPATGYNGTTLVDVSRYPDVEASLNTRMRQTITQLAAAYRTAADDLRTPPDATIPLSDPPSGAGGEPPPVGPEDTAGYGPSRGPAGIVDAEDAAWTAPGTGYPAGAAALGPAGAAPVQEAVPTTDGTPRYAGRSVETAAAEGGFAPGGSQPGPGEANAPWTAEGEPPGAVPGGFAADPTGAGGRGRGWTLEADAAVGPSGPADDTGNTPAATEGVLGRSLRREALRRQDPAGGRTLAESAEEEPATSALGGALGRRQASPDGDAPPRQTMPDTAVTSAEQPAGTGSVRPSALLMAPLSGSAAGTPTATAAAGAAPGPAVATQPAGTQPAGTQLSVTGAAAQAEPATPVSATTASATTASATTASGTTASGTTASGTTASLLRTATAPATTALPAAAGSPVTVPVPDASAPSHVLTPLTTPASSSAIPSTAAGPATQAAATVTPATADTAAAAAVPAAAPPHTAPAAVHPAAPLSVPSVGPVTAPAAPLLPAPGPLTSVPAVPAAPAAPAVPAAPAGPLAGEYRMHPPPQLLMNSFQQAGLAAGAGPADAVTAPFAPGGFPGAPLPAASPAAPPGTGLTAPFFAGNAPPPMPAPLVHDPTPAQAVAPSGVLGRPHQPDTLPPSPFMPPPAVTGHGAADHSHDVGGQRRPATWWLHLDGDDPR